MDKTGSCKARGGRGEFVGKGGEGTRRRKSVQLRERPLKKIGSIFSWEGGPSTHPVKAECPGNSCAIPLGKVRFSKHI